MRVLQVVKTTRGARWAFNQAKRLKELGVEVITVLPNTDEGTALEYRECGLQIVKGDWLLPTRKPWLFFRKKREIIRIIEDVKPDIIHLYFVSNVYMLRFALRNKGPARLFQVPGPLHLENALFRAIDIKSATEKDYWCGGCTRTNKYYLDAGIPENRVFQAYFCEILPEPSSVRTNALRNAYGIKDDEILIAMVSYFYKPKKYLLQKRGIKGHEDFIDALSIVMKKHKNIRPMIIGNAWTGAEKYEQSVKKYAQSVLGDKVIFTGYRDDVLEIYKDIDIAVHPSHSENLGGAGESLSNSVPTITTNVGGFPDLIINRVTGLLVNQKDPEELAKAINWAIENYDEMKEMAQKGKQRREILSSPEYTVNKIKMAYGEIIGYEKDEQEKSFGNIYSIVE